MRHNLGFVDRELKYVDVLGVLSLAMRGTIQETRQVLGKPLLDDRFFRDQARRDRNMALRELVKFVGAVLLAIAVGVAAHYWPR